MGGCSWALDVFNHRDGQHLDVQTSRGIAPHLDQAFVLQLLDLLLQL